MLRKTLVLFLSIFILGFFLSCSERESVLSPSETERQVVGDKIPTFNAKILEIYSNSVLVEPLEGEDILRSSNRITFRTDRLDKIGVSVNDIVTIQYTGVVMESYPAQIIPVIWSIYKKSN